MKPLLMHPDRSFELGPAGAGEGAELMRDLDLKVMLEAAAAGDGSLRRALSTALEQAPSNDVDTIRHRQGVLQDCLANPQLMRRLYAIANEPLRRDRGWDFRLYGESADVMVSSGARVLRNCLHLLEQLRAIGAATRGQFVSGGFHRFFQALEQSIGDDDLATVYADLAALTSRQGLLLSAPVGEGGLTLHLPRIACTARVPRLSPVSWLFGPIGPAFSFKLHPYDVAGARAMGELKTRGLREIADAVHGAAEEMLGFVTALRGELAFYVAAVQLKARMDEIGEQVVFPDVIDGRGAFRCANLRNAALGLRLGRPARGADAGAEDQMLVLVTGADGGGKSTFLRSVGLAQLMMQCGLFVTADAFAAPVRSGVFTHFRRGEDRNLRSGKLDEELARFGRLADHIRPGGLVLFDGSFAATHEREGAEIAYQVLTALLDCGVAVVFVTHMHELGRMLLGDERVLFLQTMPDQGGDAGPRLVEGLFAQARSGEALYRRLFATTDETLCIEQAH